MGKTNPFGAVDPALAKLGFSRIKPVRKRRISVEVSSKTKGGKTRFGLTGPQPVGILNTDRSLDDILPEFPDVDVIVKDFSNKFVPGEELSQNEAKALEADFARAYRALYEARGVRTIMVDKWTTLWEVARYAEFGKASVKAHHYVPVNLRMRGYLGMFQQHDKNLILTQDVKEEWIGEKPTGRWIVDGFKYTPGMMQVNAFMWREETGDREFMMRIDGCSLNAELVGWEFSSGDESPLKYGAISWASVATMVMPDTKVSDWQ